MNVTIEFKINWVLWLIVVLPSVLIGVALYVLLPEIYDLKSMVCLVCICLCVFIMLSFLYFIKGCKDISMKGMELIIEQEKIKKEQLEREKEDAKCDEAMWERKLQELMYEFIHNIVRKERC